MYLDVNLKMYTPETVLSHAGINDVLNDKSQTNTTRVSSEVLEKIHKKLSTFCSGYGLM